MKNPEIPQALTIQTPQPTDDQRSKGVTTAPTNPLTLKTRRRTSTIICTACQSTVEPDSSFCTECGKSLQRGNQHVAVDAILSRVNPDQSKPSVHTQKPALPPPVAPKSHKTLVLVVSILILGGLGFWILVGDAETFIKGNFVYASSERVTIKSDSLERNVIRASAVYPVTILEENRRAFNRDIWYLAKKYPSATSMIIHIQTVEINEDGETVTVDRGQRNITQSLDEIRQYTSAGIYANISTLADALEL